MMGPVSWAPFSLKSNHLYVTDATKTMAALLKKGRGREETTPLGSSPAFVPSEITL